jgi:hypothetical protein
MSTMAPPSFPRSSPGTFSRGLFNPLQVGKF